MRVVCKFNMTVLSYIAFRLPLTYKLSLRRIPSTSDQIHRDYIPERKRKNTWKTREVSTMICTFKTIQMKEMSLWDLS